MLIVEKRFLLIVGGLLVILNAVVTFCPDANAKFGVLALSGVGGLVVLFLASRLGRKEPSQSVAIVAPVVAPPPAPPRPEAEIVAFLALLQEHGRLVDFVREEIAGATDAQLGAAARVVHAGCRKVLDESFALAPVHAGEEGEAITLAVGYDAAAYRLLGTVGEHPPYQGKLLHPGWLAQSVKLPRVTGVTEQRPWPVLAPAEVEITKL